jgi:hypothetical protein
MAMRTVIRPLTKNPTVVGGDVVSVKRRMAFEGSPDGPMVPVEGITYRVGLLPKLDIPTITPRNRKERRHGRDY